MSVHVEIIDRVTAGDSQLVLMRVDGHAACISRQLGDALGWGKGGAELEAQVTGSWAERFSEGETHRTLRGAALKEVRRALAEAGERGVIPSKARKALLLFEPGVHLALAQSPTPLAIVIRRKLADGAMQRLPEHPSGPDALAPLPLPGAQIDVMIQRLRQVADLSGILKEEDFDYVVRRILDDDSTQVAAVSDEASDPDASAVGAGVGEAGNDDPPPARKKRKRSSESTRRRTA